MDVDLLDITYYWLTCIILPITLMSKTHIVCTVCLLGVTLFTIYSFKFQVSLIRAEIDGFCARFIEEIILPKFQLVFSMLSSRWSSIVKFLSSFSSFLRFFISFVWLEKNKNVIPCFGLKWNQSSDLTVTIKIKNVKSQHC